MNTQTLIANTIEANEALTLPNTLVKVTQVDNVYEEHRMLDTQEIFIIRHAKSAKTMADYLYDN